MNIKGILTNPIFIGIACFCIFMFSVNQILNLAKPSRNMLSGYAADDQLYNSAYLMASAPNVTYENITTMMSQKFPNVPTAAIKVGITPEIAKLSDKEQSNVIKMNIIDSRLTYLETKLEMLAQTENENLLLKIGFYGWGFIAWVVSVVLGHMLTHVTTRINAQYVDKWLDKKFPKN